MDPLPEVKKGSPKGPQIEKLQDLPPGLKNFKRDWKISGEDTHQGPFFVGNSESRDWNCQSRLKFLSDIENFKGACPFLQDSGPLGYFWALKSEFPGFPDLGSAWGVVWRKSPFCKIKWLSHNFYGTRTLTFMPYGPILLGLGVVFNIVRFADFFVYCSPYPHWGCSNGRRPSYFCKSIALQMGAGSWCTLVVYMLLIEMGGVSGWSQ